MEILKTTKDIWYIYEVTILDTVRKSLEHFPVRMDVDCPKCQTQGQFWWQTFDHTRLEFYCPSCNITWTIFRKEIEE